ncbi:MAG: diacylglycerol kinase family lipid kinase [Spirochaetia bacterium]|nr:diacylglycerol kinase family lipid kinase [Spirochaetia bacterium]
MSIKKDEIVFIINPVSGGGKTGKLWPEIEKKIRQKFVNITVLFTKKKAEAVSLSRKCVIAKVPIIVSVGGDGTISEVASGFIGANNKPIEKPSAKSTALGILPMGSGCDLIRTLQIPNNVDKALDIILQGKRKIIDMGMVTFKNYQKKTEKRPFINISDVGIGAQVMHIFDKQDKKWGPFISYQSATLRGVLQYKNKHFKIYLDNKLIKDQIMHSVIVANGKYFGSGMKVAREAELDDGYFNAILIDKISTIKFLMLLPFLQRGIYAKIKEINMYKVKNIKIETNSNAFIELDGEQLGTAPAEFQMINSAVSVFVP